VPARTVSRILRRHQLPYPADCYPLTGQRIRSSKQTACRYERDRPGELVHMDVKKIGKIPDGGGWRAHGRPTTKAEKMRQPKIGYPYLHSLVDDHSRLAHFEILADEIGTTVRRSCCALPPLHCGQAGGCQLGPKHKFIKPHCPWQIDLPGGLSARWRGMAARGRSARLG
jgi:Integrase core domain